MCVAMSDPRMKAALASQQGGPTYGSSKSAIVNDPTVEAVQQPDTVTDTSGKPAKVVDQFSYSDVASGKAMNRAIAASALLANTPAGAMAGWSTQKSDAVAAPPTPVDPTELALRKMAAQARRRLATTDGIGSTFLTGPMGAKARGY